MKKKILLQFFSWWLFSLVVVAQKPVIKSQAVIGGSAWDETRCTLKTKDGGVIVGGLSFSNKSGQKTQNTRSPFLSDYWVVKMNKHGKIEWDITAGGNGVDNLKSLIQTSDGGYALIGESNSYISVEKDEDTRGALDYWMVKLDKHGNIQWNKTIGGDGDDFLDNIIQTSDDGYILAGSSNSNKSGEKTEESRGDFDYWVVKLDKTGNKIWDKTIGGSDAEFCSPVTLTADGGFAIGGFSASNKSGEKSENSNGSFDLWIVKLSKTGQIEWDKTVGGNDFDYCHAMVQTSDNGYLIAGASFSNASGDKTENNRGDGSDYWLVKLNKNGKKVWDKTIGGNHDDAENWSLLHTEDGGYIFGGNSLSDISGEKTESNRGDYDIWIVKLDKNMNIEWDKTLGGSSYENLIGNEIQEIKKNVYLVGGLSTSPVSGDKTIESIGEADYWLVTIDAGKPGSPSLNSNTKEVIAAKKPVVNMSFLVYPIPAKDMLYVKTKSKATFMLTDQTGKPIFKRIIQSSSIINVSKMASGIYYLRDENTGVTQKIMIVK